MAPLSLSFSLTSDTALIAVEPVLRFSVQGQTTLSNFKNAIDSTVKPLDPYHWSPFVVAAVPGTQSAVDVFVKILTWAAHPVDGEKGRRFEL